MVAYGYFENVTEYTACTQMTLCQSLIETLLQIGGIELNPGPVRVFLTGNFHQGDPTKFSPDTVGKQCVANSIAALLFAKLVDISLWSKQHMDGILTTGDHFYAAVQLMQRGLPELWEYDDIPKDINIFGQQFVLDKHGELFVTICRSDILNCLDDVFVKQKMEHIILCLGAHTTTGNICGYASALLKHRNKFYIFDSHSHCSIRGLPTACGSSVLLLCDTFGEVTEYLLSLCVAVNAEQLSVWKCASRKLGAPRFVPPASCQQDPHVFSAKQKYHMQRQLDDVSEKCDLLYGRIATEKAVHRKHQHELARLQKQTFSGKEPVRMKQVNMWQQQNIRELMDKTSLKIQNTQKEYDECHSMFLTLSKQISLADSEQQKNVPKNVTQRTKELSSQLQKCEQVQQQRRVTEKRDTCASQQNEGKEKCDKIHEHNRLQMRE